MAFHLKVTCIVAGRLWVGSNWRAIASLSFLWLASTSVLAQEALACPDMGDVRSTPKHEIGVNVLSLVHFAYNPLYSRPEYNRLSFLNGLSYKRRVGQNAYRLSMDMFRDAFEVGVHSIGRHGSSSATGSALRTELRLGFEHQFTSGRIRPFAAGDIVVRREHVRLSGEGTGGIYGLVDPEPSGYDITSMRIGPALSLGLTCRISKRFSCAMESSVLFVLYYQDDSVLDVTRFQVYSDLLRSVSLNYHIF